jgi:hypothetical protein
MKFSTLVTRGIVFGALSTFGILHYQLRDIPSMSDSSSPYWLIQQHGQQRGQQQGQQEQQEQVACSSVEANVSFPYGASSSSSSSSCEKQSASTACAFCNQTAWVRYLSQLAQVFRSRFQHECSQLVVYSVAFGAAHESFLNQAGRNWHGDSDDLLQRHGHCFFAFVLLQEDHPPRKQDDDYLSPAFIFQHKGLEGLFHLIPVPPHILPYQNPRRNTKLFKLYGGLHLFDFADHIVWQDAKLQKKQWAQYLGIRNYTKYVQQHQHACVSLKSLPIHETALGPQRRPRFQSHCQVLLSSANHTTTRRVVSDSLAAIQKQCTLYTKLQQQQQQQQEKRRRRNSQTTNITSSSSPSFLSLDDGLIDSALISWNNNRHGCRRFNLNLSCRWISEIQCHGDRDQISFPQVVMMIAAGAAPIMLGLQQQPGRRIVQPGETVVLDKLLVEPIIMRMEEEGAIIVWEPRVSNIMGVRMNERIMFLSPLLELVVASLLPLLLPDPHEPKSLPLVSFTKTYTRLSLQCTGLLL